MSIGTFTINFFDLFQANGNISILFFKTLVGMFSHLLLIEWKILQVACISKTNAIVKATANSPCTMQFSSHLPIHSSLHWRFQTQASPDKILVNCGYCLQKLVVAPPHVSPARVTWQLWNHLTSSLKAPHLLTPRYHSCGHLLHCEEPDPQGIYYIHPCPPPCTCRPLVTTGWYKHPWEMFWLTWF